jgi:hypothetical protein
LAGRLILDDQITLDDVRRIACHLRPEEALEIEASTGGMDPEQALLESLLRSCWSWIVRDDDGPLVLFGVSVASLMDERTFVWAIPNQRVSEHRIALARASRGVIAELVKAFGPLTNWVDARHTTSLRWLRWLGAEIEEPQPFGPLGLPFHKICLRR